MAGNSSPFDHEVSRNSQVLASVATCDRESRLLALAATLRVCGEKEADQIAAEITANLALTSRTWGWKIPRIAQPWWELFYSRYLLERENRACGTAVAALISRWTSLSVVVRQAALGCRAGLSRRGDWMAGESASAPERESLVRFAVEAAEVALLPVAIAGVLDADTNVAGAAEESLVLAAASMANANIRELGVRPQGGREQAFSHAEVGWRAALHAAVAGLCERYQEHRRRGVLGAALALLDRRTMAYARTESGDPLARWLLSGSQESHPAFRSMLRRNVGPLSRLRAWEWLTREPMLAAAVERVAWADSPAEHEAVLCAAHLIENPRRADRVGLIPVKKATQAGPIPDVGAIPMLSVDARRGLVRLIQGVRTTVEQKEGLLSPILADPDSVTRLAAVGALPAPAVLDYCFDADEGVATAATLKWSWTSEATGRSPVLGHLERSGHSGLRWLAGLEREANSELSRLSEWKKLREDRAACIEGLRSTIRAGDRQQRLGAILGAQRLGVQPEVEFELLSVLSETLEPRDDGKLVAAAVTALGGAGTGSALEAVQRCLQHSIARVRSNAAEALGRAMRGRGDLPFSAPRLYESMIEMKHEGSHRVRATVLREVLSAASPQRGGTGYEPVAAEGLVEMLDDSRATHRLAALWAVERVTAGPEVGDSLSRRWNALASRVAELTHDEEDEAVRRRAVRCARRMLARMRSPLEVAA